MNRTFLEDSAGSSHCTGSEDWQPGIAFEGGSTARGWGGVTGAAVSPDAQSADAQCEPGGVAISPDDCALICSEEERSPSRLAADSCVGLEPADGLATGLDARPCDAQNACTAALKTIEGAELPDQD